MTWPTTTSWESLRILNQRVTSCNLWITSYYLLHDFWVTFYIGVTSYYLLHGSRIPFYTWVTSSYVLHKLRVNFHVRVTSYYLLHDWIFTYELRVCIYCTSCDCNFNCIKFIYYISYSFLLLVLYKIKYS